MNMSSGQHVLLTGLPGVGKTTLVRKVVQELQTRGFPVSGFYTEEVRDAQNGKRTGFQMVTLDGKRGTLASIDSSSTLKVGNYGVELSAFESTALPTLSGPASAERGGVILVIDEIGKMELFSSKFKTAVDAAFERHNFVILATLPVQKGRPIPFVEKIRNRTDAKLFTVDRSNRDKLVPDLLKVLLGHKNT